MFTMKIVNSDAFLDMPPSAQALYFHLCMRADDDGFVNNPNSIKRTAQASDADLNLLREKRFILGFDSGVIVIKHWRMHNLLRKDRYNATQYIKEKESLIIKDDGSYTEKPPKNPLAAEWQPNGNQTATQDSVGKDSIVKDSLGECECKSEQDDLAHTTTPTLDDVINYCKSKNYNFAEKFFAYYQSVNWLDKNGKPIDWQSKADYWKLCDDEKAPKTRYGNFDVNEAFDKAIARSYDGETKEEPKTAGNDPVVRERAEAMKRQLSESGV